MELRKPVNILCKENGEYGTCDGSNMWLTVSGTALDASNIAFQNNSSSPTDVSIVITKDTPRSNQSFQPEYE